MSAYERKHWNLSQAAAWVLYRDERWVKELAKDAGLSFGAMQLYPSLHPRPDPPIGSQKELHHALLDVRLVATGVRLKSNSDRQVIPEESWIDLHLHPPRAYRQLDQFEPWTNIRVKGADCRKLWRGSDEKLSRTDYDWTKVRQIYDEVFARMPDASGNKLIEEIQEEYEACSKSGRSAPSRSRLQTKIKGWRAGH
jgi:hypothetical protein